MDTDTPKKSSLISRNIMVNNRRTSVRLENEMWVGLFEIATREKISIHDICTMVAEAKREETSLTAAIRVFVMAYYKSAATEEGHQRAGHGGGNILHVYNTSGPRNKPHDISRIVKTRLDDDLAITQSV